MNFLTTLGKFLIIFCKETSIHGLSHVVAAKRHWIERLLWLTVVLISGIGCLFIIESSWNKYYHNPVITSLDMDYKNFKVLLPSTTLILGDPAVSGSNKGLPEAIVERIWNVSSGEKFDYYMRFVREVAKSRIQDIGDFSEFTNDITVDMANKADIAMSVISKDIYTMVTAGLSLAPSIIRRTYRNNMSLTLTELGIGLSIFSTMTDLTQATLFPKRPVTFNDVECVSMLKYCRLFAVTDWPSTMEAYIYSPMDILDTSMLPRATFFKDVAERDEMAIELMEGRIYADDDLRELSVQQRKCYFEDEQVLGSFKGYSYNICRSYCRRQVFIEKCGCAPFFYAKFDNASVCTVAGMICASKIAPDIIEYFNGKNRESDILSPIKQCVCLPACSELIYSKISDRILLKNADQHRIDASFLVFSEVRYRRRIIFTFSDLLVNFGGTAGLFLGCSVLTLIETLYFITIGAIKFVRQKSALKLRKGDLFTAQMNRIKVRLGMNAAN